MLTTYPAGKEEPPRSNTVSQNLGYVPRTFAGAASPRLGFAITLLGRWGFSIGLSWLGKAQKLPQLETNACSALMNASGTP